jgi:hypothetical protein
MNAKRAVVLVNRETVRPDRLWPSIAQVEAFLRADGWAMTAEIWTNDRLEKVWQKRRTADAPEPHEVRTPVEPARDTVRRIAEILDTIATMKGDRWALAEIGAIMAKIEVK